MKKYWVALQVVVMLTSVRIGLQLASLPRLLRLIDQPLGISRGDQDEIERVADYVDRLLRVYPANPKGNCLPRALVLYSFARRYGFPVQFRCGVRKVEKSLDGHAWVTLDDVPFLEPTNHCQQFSVTLSFPNQSERRDPHGEGA